MKIKKFSETFEYPSDIPPELDKERLYASGENSKPGERLKNYLTPFFSYFQLTEKNPDQKEMIEELRKGCYELLPYIKYWLRKVE